MRKQFAVALVVLSLLSSNAWALTLNEARTQGRVGETLNGYLVALQTDAETQALVSEINKARNASYQQLAEHYQIAVMPARPYKPKDKAKAEVGVQIVERWILARLRHHTFFSLAEVNQCIRTLLMELN